MIRNVLEYLEASAERCPDKMALQDENESLTYREYVTRAKTAATYLATHETKGFKNRPVAVIIDRNILHHGKIEIRGSDFAYRYRPSLFGDGIF